MILRKLKRKISLWLPILLFFITLYFIPLSNHLLEEKLDSYKPPEPQQPIIEEKKKHEIVISDPTEIKHKSLHDEQIQNHPIDQEALKKLEQSDIRPCLAQYAYKRQYPQLVKCIMEYNANAPILNAHIYQDEDIEPILFTMIVHKRDLYFKHVLKYLRQVEGIERVLLIVSHDGYHPALVQMVQQIDFCRVKQIFHPYARGLTDMAFQLYSAQTTTETLNSVTVEYLNHVAQLKYDYEKAQDSFISSPYLKQTAPKHHYWWLWHYLFLHQAQLPKYFQSQLGDFHVAFFEEDHVMTPDYLDLLKKMIYFKQEHCPECYSLNLGYHDMKIDRFQTSKWNAVSPSIVNNIGLVFNKTAFELLREQRELFCGFDDYNWDLTMNHLSQIQALPEPSLTVGLSRVLHIGSCGMHTKNKNCDPSDMLELFSRDLIEPLKIQYESYTNYKNHDSPIQAYFQTHFLEYNQEWRETPFSQRPRSQGVEGWRSGRLWADNQPGVMKELWKSDINYQHCLLIANGEIGWK